MNVLSVERLSKSFGGVHAVADASFEVNAGQIVALIGPNGAGKTTCFNMLNGQLSPDSGSVRLQGREITGMRPRAIYRLGVGRTFQITQTFASMSVRENIQMALISHHRRTLSFTCQARSLYEPEADALLKLVNMDTHAERSCGALAYGDLKRVELAVALANDPKLLLMDEPTAGMPSLERHELMRLIGKIVKARGISVLFTEHDMDIVFTQADSIIVLNRGRVIARGVPQDVRNDPRVRESYLGSGSMFKQ